MNELFHLLVLSCIVLVWVVSLSILRDIVSRGNPEVERLKREIERLEREREKQRQYYERLLRDTTIRNTIALAVYEAWKTGKLKECYMKGGEVRVLADGTVICELPEKEKSYAIGVKE